jgi:hypothetical protein
MYYFIYSVEAVPTLSCQLDMMISSGLVPTSPVKSLLNYSSSGSALWPKTSIVFVN